MSVYFDNIDIAVNYSGILATRATIDSSNSIEGAFLLGRINQFNTIPVGPIKTTFKFEYIPEISQEPNFVIVNKIKNLIIDTGYHGEKVELAGITQDNCFLNSYSLRAQPNNAVQASVSFISFFPVCDSQTEKQNLTPYINDGNMPHYFSTYVLNSGDNIDKPVYNLEYNFTCDWNPVYVIGRKYPVAIKMLNAVETLNFGMDTFKSATFSGQKLTDSDLFNLSDSNTIKFSNLSLICSNYCSGNSDNLISIPIDKFKIINTNLSAGSSEYIRSDYTCVRYY